jgi:hypothetical protein
MSDRDPKDDELDDEEDDEEDESPPPPKAKKQPVSTSNASPAKSKAAAPRGKGRALVPSSNLIAIGVVALLVGGALGWFGQIEKAKAALRAESAAPAGSGAAAGPCGAFQSKICASAGLQSASCQEAKGAADLLLPATCESALGALPETLAKLKAARASCDKLVAKLCQDLPPGSKTCDMVKERTPSFPRERCDQMMQSYDKVIAELKQMDQQGGMQMGGGPRMQPGGTPPGGMPPGGMPHMTMPGTLPPGHVAMPPATAHP